MPLRVRRTVRVPRGMARNSQICRKESPGLAVHLRCWPALPELAPHALVVVSAVLQPVLLRVERFRGLCQGAPPGARGGAQLRGSCP